MIPLEQLMCACLIKTSPGICGNPTFITLPWTTRHYCLQSARLFQFTRSSLILHDPLNNIFPFTTTTLKRFYILPAVFMSVNFMDLKKAVIIPFTRLLTVIMYDKIVNSNTTHTHTFIYVCVCVCFVLCVVLCVWCVVLCCVVLYCVLLCCVVLCLTE